MDMDRRDGDARRGPGLVGREQQPSNKPLEQRAPWAKGSGKTSTQVGRAVDFGMSAERPAVQRQDVRQRAPTIALAPENTSWMKAFRAGAAEIKERTDGRVVLKFCSGGVQGTEAKVLRKIQIGQLHGSTFAPMDFQKKYPELNIYGLPFVFESEDEVNYVRKRMDSKLQQGLQKLGFTSFGFASGGFAIVMSNEPIRGHADLKGKKVWLPQGDLISYEAMKALQLSPVSLPITDVLTGLQTGLIEIVAIPPVVALALQWHTKVRYVTQMPVLYAMGFLGIQSKVLARLDDADRAVVTEVLSRIYAEVNAASPQETLNATQALINIGLENVEPNEGEFERMRDLMVETNRDMAKREMFSLELLDEMQGHIDEYRNCNRASGDGNGTAASGNKE